MVSLIFPLCSLFAHSFSTNLDLKPPEPMSTLNVSQPLSPSISFSFSFSFSLSLSLCLCQTVCLSFCLSVLFECSVLVCLSVSLALSPSLACSNLCPQKKFPNNPENQPPQPSNVLAHPANNGASLVQMGLFGSRAPPLWEKVPKRKGDDRV